MTVRPTPDIGVQFIERAEGEKNVVYLDKGGRPTGGTGHLLTAAERAQYPMGNGGVIPQEQIDTWLRDDLQHATDELASVIAEATILALTDHQYAALISFVFNVGCNPSWTIWKVIKAGNLDQVPGQLARFDKVTEVVNGKAQAVVVKGLVNRRSAEKLLWLTPDLEAAVTCATACPLEQPSSYTRDAITPPTPGLLPVHFVASAVAKSGTVVGGIGSAAATVQEQLAPHADISPIFHQALVICVGITIVCGVVGLAISHTQAKAAVQ